MPRHAFSAAGLAGSIGGNARQIQMSVFGRRIREY